MVDDKLKKGIAEPCTGSWSAPTLMVPKKDGRMRMCVDLRALNAVTTLIIYPIPRPEDMFDAVKGAKCSLWVTPPGDIGRWR